MRILVIPNSLECNWEKFIKNEKIFDHIIFMGDYFDTSKHDIINCIDNAKKLLKYVDLNKIEFLLGDNDISYMSNKSYKAKSYRPDYDNTIHDILSRLDAQICTWLTVRNNTYLFSHSGFNKLWCDRHPDIIDYNRIGLVKRSYDCNHFYKAFSEIGCNNDGESIVGSPITCDITDVIEHPINIYIQVICSDKNRVTDNLISINEPYIISNNNVESYDGWVERIKKNRNR